LTLEGLGESIPWVPVPLKEIVRGEFGALLTSETEPVTLPAEVGAKTTLKVVFFPAAIVAGTVRPLMLKPVPDTVACEIVRVAVPPLVRLIVCELLLPVTTLPKLALVGLAESCG
jgi:hypothetical protein